MIAPSQTPAPAAPGQIDRAAYLARIGVQDEVAPTLATLHLLQLAHLRTVPFENLDIHLGRPIVLDEARLFDKIVTRRRGGFCYELNGLFAALLREIGFSVTLLGAQFPSEDGHPAPELDHLTLLVNGEGFPTPLLADIGAGRGSFARPLRMDTTLEQWQPEAGAGFRLLPENAGMRLWRREPGGTWEREFAYTWTPRQLADFQEGCHFHQTSPDSHFTRQRISTLMTPRGRVTISERRLIVTQDGVRTEQELPDETAWHDALRAHFGIDLER